MVSILPSFVSFMIIKLIVESCPGATGIEFQLQTFDKQARDGIAEIFYNGTWGAVEILANFYSTTPDFSAKALCNSMGYGYEGFVTLNRNHNTSGTLFLTWLTGFTCTANHTNATECLDETAFTLRNATVTTILHCYPLEITDIRLIKGTLPSEGLLVVNVSNRWAAVCDNANYNIKDTLDDMMCRTLGYVEESVIQPADHGRPYAIMKLQSCPDNIGSIFDITPQCQIQTVWPPQMGFDEVYKQINCQTIRLVDGPSALKGRVEAGLFGQLRTICGLGFDVYAANVTCTSLGYSGSANFSLKTSYGFGNLSLYKKKITCSGRELSLEHCNHSVVDIEECGDDDVVSVDCRGGQMKLNVFNMTRPYEGLFTAFYGGHWYDVLGNVSINTAQTLCSMLGFGYVGFPTLSRYGKYLEYYKTNITCRENVSHVDECSSDFQYCANKAQENCFRTSLGDLLALFCSDYTIQKIALVYSDVQLTINNETWSVCNITSETAASVCRILGYVGHNHFWLSNVSGSDKAIIGDLICESEATTVAQCKLRHQYSYGLYAEGRACSSKIGITCKEECRQGFFGQGCSQCHCKSESTLSCNTITGECTCKQGWSGITCSDDVNECETATAICRSPLICMNTAGSYVCRCPVGMYVRNTSDGEHCEGATGFEFRLRTFDEQARDGIAEIFYNGIWAAVDIQPNFFTTIPDFTPKALCNSIGFGYDGFVTLNRNHNASGTVFLTWLTGFTCTTNHTNATECLNKNALILRNTTVSTILHCYPFEVTDIRLTGGILPNEGLLEVRVSNRWAAILYVSRYNVKDTFDDMICRTLGYVEESVIPPASHGMPYAIMKIQSCANNISSIYDIPSLCNVQTVWLSSGRDELYKEINCQPIRLIDGPSFLEGRVEVGLFGMLRTVCGLGFDEHAANVTCTSLGKSGLAHFNLKTRYGTGNLPLYSRKISCSGLELSLEHCNHSGFDIEACGKEDAVSVTCIGGPMKMEVFNEARPYEGLFTAFHGGHLYYVLGNVSLNTARKLCSMLGFGYVGFPTVSRYGKFLEYYKTNISCHENASHIDECSGDLQYCAIKGQDNCYQTSLTGLLALFCSDYEIQHVSLEKIVIELTINNETWSVCKDDFTADTADSVCRIAGYTGSITLTYAPVHNSDKEIIGSLLCEPGASTLQECKIRHQYSDNMHAQEPGCTDKIAVSCQNVLRLVDGPSSLEGRIETVLFGHHWAICGLGFDEKAAKVACTSLGYSELSEFYLKTTYGIGNLSLYSKNISCTGKELTLEECRHSYTDNEACSNNDIVSVACKGSQLKLERFNEARRYEGVLSTYHNGNWYDILRPVSNVTARTLCSMLGFGAVGFSAPARYGKNVYRFKTNISCNGNEKHIDECSGLMQYCIAPGNYCIQMSRTAGLLTLFCSDYDIQSIALLAGVVELRINNETWSVCNDHFTNETADSVCRILGYTGSTLFRSAPVQDGELEVIGNLICDSGAVTLSQCKLKHQYSYRPYVSGSECSTRIELVCKNECRQGYFGSDCSQCLCKSVNTQSCHNITGECTCKHGWSGTTCSDDVNECLAATDICKDPSVCVNTAGSYFCQCPVGMYMKDTSCEVCTNNTHGLNCLETCSCFTMNTYVSDQMCDPKAGQCFCKPEWTGNACDNDVNECLSPSSYKCLENNTACVNEEGGYKCDCIEGFKRENGLICVPVTSLAEAEGMSSLTITAIASSAGGSIIIIIVVIAVAVACVRRHKGKAERYKNESKEKHWQQPSVEYTEGTNNTESDHYNVLDGYKRVNSTYQTIKHDDDANNGYIDLSKCLNDNYDVLDDAKIQKLRSEEMASDGYFNPTCGNTDDKYVSNGYLKPISKENPLEGDYLKPQRTDEGASNDYLRI